MRLPIASILVALCASVIAAEPVPPEQAFRVSARALDSATVEARWDIRKDYYLYKQKFKFLIDGVVVAPIEFPPAKQYKDEIFGDVEIYRGSVNFRLPPPAAAQGTAGIDLEVGYQGCWDGGICYPPQKQLLRVDLSGVAPASAQPTSEPSVAPAPGSQIQAPPAGDGDDTSIARLLDGGSLALILASFFGFGLLLAFTPCMFPMIPILSGIIVKHGHAVTHVRAFVLSLTYVLGMAATYAAIGVAAGLSGTLLSAALQNAWVLASFAALFVVLSLSMFGFYELQLPTALQSRISDSANAQGGSIPAIALMGALSSLIVGPCVAAPLAGALLYIAKTGDAVLGGAALFTLALGMGAPLLLVGAFSRSLLPRSGPWMTAVNRFFGVLMLATALWLVSPVLPTWVVMAGWAALLIVPAIYLHALDPLPPAAHGWQRFGKGLGVISLLAGTAMLLGLLGGARDPLQPLSFLRIAGTAAGPASSAPSFVKVASVAELDLQLAAAAKANKIAMLDFYADWCVSCKEMERFTFADPVVAGAMRELVLLKADVTANNEEDKALLARFKLFGPPGIIFFRDGRELDGHRVVGFLPAERFLAVIERARKGAA